MQLLECGCEIDSEEPCEKCCEHTDIEYDEGCCLVCGTDLTERLVSAAYDYCKGRAEDGY
jgi:hypothetical protein